MPVYKWKFLKTPEPYVVEMFLDAQIPMFSRNTDILGGADGRHPVSIWDTTHADHMVCKEFELCNIPDNGDHFCFPGFFACDGEENVCDTKGLPYGQIVGAILRRAQGLFDMQVEVIGTPEKTWVWRVQ